MASRKEGIVMGSRGAVDIVTMMGSTGTEGHLMAAGQGQIAVMRTMRRTWPQGAC
jgi:hypothetical protein